MLNKLNNCHKNQKGITGLETAIILIAFVVVASVFAYTVLSAGLFSTQKSQEAVYSGLSEAQSTMQPVGSVTATSGDVDGGTLAGAVGDDGFNSVGSISFMVSLSSGGSDGVDLTPSYTWDDTNGMVATDNNRTQITFTDADVSIADCAWTVSWVGGSPDGNDILQGNEKALITVYLHSLDDASVWAPGAAPFLGADRLGTYSNFSIEVKPATGAVLNISRTTPAVLNLITDLH